MRISIKTVKEGVDLFVRLTFYFTSFQCTGILFSTFILVISSVIPGPGVELMIFYMLIYSAIHLASAITMLLSSFHDKDIGLDEFGDFTVKLKLWRQIASVG